MGDSGPRKEEIPGIPRRRREAIPRENRLHPLQNPPKVLCVFIRLFLHRCMKITGRKVSTARCTAHLQPRAVSAAEKRKVGS